MSLAKILQTKTQKSNAFKEEAARLEQTLLDMKNQAEAEAVFEQELQLAIQDCHKAADSGQRKVSLSPGLFSAGVSIWNINAPKIAEKLRANGLIVKENWLGGDAEFPISEQIQLEISW